MAVPSPSTIDDRIKVIIRRDLRLGGHAEIPPDMPLLGGDVDLDSLDLLLLLTSIEKEFGLKIPSQPVGQEVFQNLATLVQYVGQHAADTGGNAGAAPDVTNVVRVSAEADSLAAALARLPHADPFRFVTRLTTLDPGQSGKGVWMLTGGETFLAGHFPGEPMVPGVLIAEALAQLSGIVVASHAPAAAPTRGRLAHVDVRFEQTVVPPAELELESRFTRAVGALHQFDVAASAAGRVVARGTISLELAHGVIALPAPSL